MILEEQFGHTLDTLNLSLWLRCGVFPCIPPLVSGWFVNYIFLNRTALCIAHFIKVLLVLVLIANTAL